MKQNIRAIGIDDAPFQFSDKNVLVVGSLVRAPNYLEGILSTYVKVDGLDATKQLINMINNSRFREQVRIIFLDGACLGGFNLVYLKDLYNKTDIPVVSISREKPDFKSIKSAMKKHLEGWKERFKKLKEGKIYKIDTVHKPIFVQVEGEEIKKVEDLLKLFTVRGRIPEPIRISHIVASGIVRGESKGKA
ncbi:MAG: DUF99 family protein [Thermoplasmatota archaeon]